ncbi:MAG: DUF4956 domain-containing protein [Deltaproteobacteria bacterium]|nr:DUF4956 domain-containing protein [Deltaproteobacteria bacterium]
MELQKAWTELFRDPTVLPSIPGFLVNLAVAALLAFLLGRAYVRFGKSPSNRKAFASNFLLLAVTTALIISIVKSSLALSLGLVGALSIVRFRAAIKEPEELAYLFIAIGIGLGLGAGQVVVTVAAVLFILALILARSMGRKSADGSNLWLSVTSPAPGKLTASRILEVLKAAGATARLNRLDDTPEQTEALLEVGFRNEGALEEATKRLREQCEGVKISYLADRSSGS